MNEDLLTAGWEQVCDQLAAIRKTGEWERTHSSFDAYAKSRWSLSKTRAKLFCDFSKFCSMCRQARLPLPDAPDNVAPILRLTQKRWLEVWQMAVNYQDGAINAQYCESVMSQFGVIKDKKLPPHVINGMRVRKAAKTMAEIGDGEALVDQVGTRGLGKSWDECVKVVIDADQARMDRDSR